MVIIYELEDKVFWISKLQIDRNFWPVLYLKHEIQEYKNKGMKLKRKNAKSNLISIYIQLLSNVTMGFRQRVKNLPLYVS